MLLISAAQDFVDLSVRVDELANVAGLDHGFDRIVTILAIACAITVTGSGFLDLSNIARAVCIGVAIICGILAFIAWKCSKSKA